MSAVTFSRLARDDLLDLWVFIARRNSPEIADGVLDRIEDACRGLSLHPRKGRARPEIAQAARSVVVARWLILYEATAKGARVMRVVDGARDLEDIVWRDE